MKGFHRDCTEFSLCGLSCALCSMKLGGYCPGCGGGAGNQSCTMAKCSMEKGVDFCHDCRAYPCEKFQSFDEFDSFVPHSSRERDSSRFQEVGQEAYLSELSQKRVLYEHLLNHYNDGRRKGFFNLAVYLLPIHELQSVADSLPKPEEMPSKERCALAVSELQRLAADRGITLKLRKKPKK